MEVAKAGIKASTERLVNAWAMVSSSAYAAEAEQQKVEAFRSKVNQYLQREHEKVEDYVKSLNPKLRAVLERWRAALNLRLGPCEPEPRTGSEEPASSHLRPVSKTPSEPTQVRPPIE